jgi:hypothetical protein
MPETDYPVIWQNTPEKESSTAPPRKPQDFQVIFYIFSILLPIILKIISY